MTHADTFQSSEREWDVPNRSWLMRMKWHDLLFMHYPLRTRELRPLIPEPLEIDTFDGTAWIGIVPFRMTDVAPRYIPGIPPLSNFPELNVRTYVTIDGKPGVWFFCLEATNPLAVRIARRFFHLPYMDASIRFVDHADQGDQWIDYRSQRTHRHEKPAELQMRYRPKKEPFRSEPGSLEHFLTARYCLYSANAEQKIYRGEIDHPPWQLQLAEGEVEINTMLDWLGLQIPDTQPLLHFARSTTVRAWSIQKI